MQAFKGEAVKKKKVGFYGGTFDPIHLGHLNLCIELQEKHGLDEVWLCPAFGSPFKNNAPPVADAKHRLEMVKRAVETIPHFHVRREELDAQKICFTIDTIRLLKEKYPQNTFFLLLGDDLLDTLHKWKESDTLLKLAKPLAGSRLREQPIDFKGLTKTNLFEISATDVRKRLKMRKYCGHLLPAKVLDYIKQNQLYYSS